MLHDSNEVPLFSLLRSSAQCEQFPGFVPFQQSRAHQAHQAPPFPAPSRCSRSLSPRRSAPPTAQCRARERQKGRPPAIRPTVFFTDIMRCPSSQRHNLPLPAVARLSPREDVGRAPPRPFLEVRPVLRATLRARPSRSRRSAPAAPARCSPRRRSIREATPPPQAPLRGPQAQPRPSSRQGTSGRTRSPGPLSGPVSQADRRPFRHHAPLRTAAP